MHATRVLCLEKRIYKLENAIGGLTNPCPGAKNVEPVIENTYRWTSHASKEGRIILTDK